MKLLIGVDEFREAFAVAGRFVPTKSPQPVYSGVKLLAAGGIATLMARDPVSGVGVRHDIPGAVVEADGVTLLPRATVDAILRSAESEVVSVATDGPKLTIKGKSSRWSVATSDPAEFPDCPGFEGDAAFTVLAGDFKQLVARTAHATGESSRYALAGMLVEWGDERVTFTASDGRKICRASADGATPGRLPDGQLVLPAPAAKLIEATFPDPLSAVEFGFVNGSMVARSGGTIAFARLLEAPFPKLIPRESPDDADLKGSCDPRGLRGALGRASAALGETSHAIRFAFNGDGVTLEAADAEGEAVVDFPFFSAGDPIETAFSVDHLTPSFKSAGDSPASLAVYRGGEMMGLHSEGFDAWFMAMTLEAPK